MTTTEKLERFRGLLEAEQTARWARLYPALSPPVARVKVGRKYANVDVGDLCNMSGRYMVDLATGEIFGIKAYGVIHRGHRYGTLDTVEAWNWEGYTAGRAA